MNRDDSFAASGVSRREFVKLAVAGGVVAATAPSTSWAADSPQEMPRRKLGRTGEANAHLAAALKLALAELNRR